MRIPSDQLRSLSRESLTQARWNRVHRSASLRERIASMRLELADVRSELHEIEVLLHADKQPLAFPVPEVVKPKTERYERPHERDRREAIEAESAKRSAKKLA